MSGKGSILGSIVLCHHRLSRRRDRGDLKCYRWRALSTTPFNCCHYLCELLFACPGGDMLLHVLVTLRANDRLTKRLKFGARGVFVLTVELRRTKLGGRPVVVQILPLQRWTM